jgi:hypothetical protein
MKLRSLLLVCTMVLLVMAMVAMPVSAKAPKTYFTGTESEYAGPPAPPTGDDWYNRSGTKWFITETAYALDDTSDDRLDGLEIMNLFLVIDTRTWKAALVGTLEIHDFTDGQIGSLKWTGIVAGNGDMVTEGYHFTYHVIAHGEGPYKGLVAQIDYEGISTDVPNAFIMSGYIVEIGVHK